MAMYTLYMIKSTSSVAAIDIVDLDNDEAARLHARSLCERQNSCIRVEIWQGDRLVADRSCSGGWPLAETSDEAPQTSPA